MGRTLVEGDVALGEEAEEVGGYAVLSDIIEEGLIGEDGRGDEARVIGEGNRVEGRALVNVCNGGTGSRTATWLL